MKKLTFSLTLIAIVVGIWVVFNGLLNPIVGFILGLFLISPLFVTLLMSRFLSGFATQIILLCSTFGYLGYFIYLFHFDLKPNGNFKLLTLAYSIPVMVTLWFVASFFSLSNNQVEESTIRDK